ncbi:MAG TPA: hypothetical protein VI413_05790 [Paludibacter sp.]
MDYRDQLKNPASLRYIDKLVEVVIANPVDFETIYLLIFDADLKVAWRAAWSCEKISEKHVDWFNDMHFNELVKLFISTKHEGLQRGCISILNNLPLPNLIPVDLINICFERMVSLKSPIAVQALSMKMLLRICKNEPDFIPELKAYLENIDPGSYSAGFNSTRKNVLKALNNK